MLSKIKRLIKGKQERIETKKYKAELAFILSFSEACSLFKDRNSIHAYMVHYFNQHCPKEIMAHRKFFSQKKRGFGEDAFHAMWWLILNEFKPKKMLEIGVYRGQVISLWGLIGKLTNRTLQISGISPFSPIGDTVSIYSKHFDYLEDTNSFFKHFDLPPPVLIKDLSTGGLAKKHITENEWDLIYLDGCHDFDVVLQDYHLCLPSLKSGGLLVLDDSSLYTDFQPKSFSSKGHPGPSRVFQEYSINEMTFLGGVGHNNVLIKK